MRTRAVGETADARSRLGLTESQKLAEAELPGVAAALVLIGLVAVPQIVGIVLGVKARRLGERRLGTVGVVLNAASARSS